MEKYKKEYESEMVKSYDEEAKASNWLGPQVAFGLSFEYITPDETILDIGIGTGLTAALYHKAGLKVKGMDISEKMLEACRNKNIGSDLVLHDLTITPYPFKDESMDHAVCTGVMNFFKDLSPIFQEAARILRDQGVFTFIVADKTDEDPDEIQVGHEHTHSDQTITMFRHSKQQIKCWSVKNGFCIQKSMEFPVPMDHEQRKIFKAKVYLAFKKIDP